MDLKDQSDLLDLSGPLDHKDLKELRVMLAPKDPLDHKALKAHKECADQKDN